MDIVQLHTQNNEDTKELFKVSCDPCMTSMVWTHAYGLDHAWSPYSSLCNTQGLVHVLQTNSIHINAEVS